MNRRRSHNPKRSIREHRHDINLGTLAISVLYGGNPGHKLNQCDLLIPRPSPSISGFHVGC